MNPQKIFDLIEKSKHIALALPEKPTLDCLAAAEVLACSLAERGKSVGFLRPVSLSKNTQETFFPKLAESPPLPRNFVISLNTKDSPVAQLRYETEEGRLNIILSPKHRSIKESSISYGTGKLLCDCAILFGTRDDELPDTNKNVPPDFFTETPLVHIDNKPHPRESQESDFIDPKKSSLSELAYAMVASQSGSPLSPEYASLLLTGIAAATKDFKAPSVSADTLQTASELMRIGAKKLDAQATREEQFDIDRIHLFGRAAVRSRIEKERRIFFSYLTHEDFEKTGSSKEAVPCVLARLKDAFPFSRAYILIWESDGTKETRICAAGDIEKLERALGIPEERDENECAVFPDAFPNIKEAEEKVFSLLTDEI